MEYRCVGPSVRSCLEMGAADSRCADLLAVCDWDAPALANEFHIGSLKDFLLASNLEVSLPRHAPPLDPVASDRKVREFPRPKFCAEGCKMHLALLGPSTACKKQFVELLPQLAAAFRGPSCRLSLGRQAVPYYFFDRDLHRLVVWELPEISWGQKSDDYIKELGLLYVDCVFMMFSEKYMPTDVYCKLCVSLAVHGIPFFIICTCPSGSSDDEGRKRIERTFRRNDMQVRMFEPDAPHAMLEELLGEMTRHILWNRTPAYTAKGAAASVLGQTIRIKGLEKRPELNERYGLCVGHDNDTGRYRVRISVSGEANEVALKDSNFSVLKHRLVGCLARLRSLHARPELNGQVGFVDEFLRDTERYRVFVPSDPGSALVLALRAENLEAVSGCSGPGTSSKTAVAKTNDVARASKDMLRPAPVPPPAQTVSPEPAASALAATLEDTPQPICHQTQASRQQGQQHEQPVGRAVADHVRQPDTLHSLGHQPEALHPQISAQRQSQGGQHEQSSGDKVPEGQPQSLLPSFAKACCQPSSGELQQASTSSRPKMSAREMWMQHRERLQKCKQPEHGQQTKLGSQERQEPQGPQLQRGQDGPPFWDAGPATESHDRGDLMARIAAAEQGVDAAPARPGELDLMARILVAEQDTEH